MTSGLRLASAASKTAMQSSVAVGTFFATPKERLDHVVDHLTLVVIEISRKTEHSSQFLVGIIGLDILIHEERD